MPTSFFLRLPLSFTPTVFISTQRGSRVTIYIRDGELVCIKKNLKSGVYIYFSFTLGYKIYSCRSPIYVHIYKCGNGSVKSIHAGRFVNTYIPYTIGSDGEVDLISLLTLWMGNVMRMPPLGEDVKKLCTVHPQMLKTKQKNLDNFFRLKKKQDLHVENALGYLSS